MIVGVTSRVAETGSGSEGSVPRSLVCGAGAADDKVWDVVVGGQRGQQGPGAGTGR